MLGNLLGIVRVRIPYHRRETSMEWEDNLPDVSLWQPDSGHKENLSVGLMLTCQASQSRIVAEAGIERRFNVNNFDSGPGVEDIVRQEISKLLPDRYSVDPGVVNDQDGRTAGDYEVLIRNGLWAPVVKLGATPASRRFHFQLKQFTQRLKLSKRLGSGSLMMRWENSSSLLGYIVHTTRMVT